MTEFQFDVFISYAHDDSEWAKRVYDSLLATIPPNRIFFDSQSLRAGDDWDERIQKSLENSRSLIVLWSDSAKASDWVNREVYGIFVPIAKSKVDPSRRMIVVNLQGMNRALSSFQQVSQPALLDMYTGSTPFTLARWQETASAIHSGLDPSVKTVSVPLVVLTMTLAEFDSLAPAERNQIRNDLDLDDAFIRSRYYGATRDDWRPYGGALSIADFVNDVQISINAALRSYRLVWRRPDDAFWSDNEVAARYAREEFNTSDLSVLIIDPVAIYSRTISQQLTFFQESLANDRRVIVTLPPFDIPPQLLQLRKMLSKQATAFFYDYFQPSVPPARRMAAQCAWNAADKEDIKRHILTAAGGIGIARAADETSSFLRHGRS